jgi:hypothetical protein
MYAIFTAHLSTVRSGSLTACVVALLVLQTNASQVDHNDDPKRGRTRVINLGGIQVIGSVSTFKRGTPWKDAFGQFEKELEKKPLKGKIAIGADEQVALVLWVPDDAPRGQAVDLSFTRPVPIRRLGFAVHSHGASFR